MAIAPSPKQTALAIDFLIIGGGLAGLACAVALRRVGHRVVLLERSPSIAAQPRSGGCRMSPNFSKILYHWGLEEELRKIVQKSDGLDLLLLETGEILGTHIWDEEILRETRGDLIFTHYQDVQQLLCKTAISLGAKVRFNTQVTSIDPTVPKVTLSTGEVLRADVIVGADGVNGLSRPFLLGDDEEPSPRINVYSTTIPKEAILADGDLGYIYGHKHKKMFAWFGNGNAVLAFPIGGQPDLAVIVYAPADGNEGTWDAETSLKNMQKAMEPCEPRVRKLGKLARPPICVPVIDHPGLENWVDESGRMVLIGEAAHPLPPGCYQQCAISVEDGAVLAKLFSHLRTHDQITNFLYAFQDIRQPRCAAILKKEHGDVAFMTFPPGAMQEYRDSALRTKRDAGVDVLNAGDGEEETPEWAEIKDIFGYDAEDEADNWWVEWGMLRERANGLNLACDIFGSMTVERKVAVRSVDVVIEEYS